MMSDWLKQLKHVLGNNKPGSTGAQGLSKMLAPGALGGLAGLLIASKSSRKLLSKYGKNALIIGGSAPPAHCCGININTASVKRMPVVRAVSRGSPPLIVVQSALFWRWSLPPKAMDILTATKGR